MRDLINSKEKTIRMLQIVATLFVLTPITAFSLNPALRPQFHSCAKFNKDLINSWRIRRNKTNFYGFTDGLKKRGILYFSSNRFDDMEDEFNLSNQSTNINDLTGCTVRQFSLGYDITLTRFSGSMGFDEVTDWDYFTNPFEAKSELERDIVQPPPLDPTKPKRTKTSSGSVVRLFLGELQGGIASKLRSKGLDYRVLVKEFAGDMAKDLAKAELSSLSKLQSELCKDIESATNGEWSANGAGRFLLGKAMGNTKEDDASLVSFCELLSKKKVPFVGILGGLNISDFEDDDMFDPNEWYRFLGVKPPLPGSIWIVYEYSGLNTLAGYAEPASLRRSKMPTKRGVFGMPVSPPVLAPWSERANYVVNGIMKGSLEALVFLHDNGVVHRSIGRNSIIVSSVGMDKAEASSPFATLPSRLSMKLSDFGFSGNPFQSTLDSSFCSRARGFGINVREGDSSISASAFAFAEDLHALGFVFLGLLLSSLAELPSSEYRIPATDEDSLQRLLGEIFKKDMKEFRDYCIEEDAWSRVVQLLDDNDGAGWQLLQSMCFARERVGELQGSFQLVTARSLLSNPIFNQ